VLLESGGCRGTGRLNINAPPHGRTEPLRCARKRPSGAFYRSVSQEGRPSQPANTFR
jgi:hypothetical protein